MGKVLAKKTNLKLLIPVLILLIVGLAAGVYFFVVPFLTKKDNAYHGPAAKLHGQVISDQDFNQNMNQVMRQASNDASVVPTMGEILDRALTLSIKDIAFQQEMAKTGSKVKVNNDDIDQFIKGRWPTEEEIQIAMKEHGVHNKSELRMILKDYLATRKFTLYKARQLKMTAPKEEVLARLEQITVSQIFIATQESATAQPIRTAAEALKKAKAVYQKIIDGGNFSDLAKQYSDDFGSKDQGGSLGTMPLDRFKQTVPPELCKATLALQPNEISQPIEYQALITDGQGKPVWIITGYYIMKLDSREMPRGYNYSIQYKEAVDDLLFQKTQEEDSAYAAWINENLQKALNQMEVLDPFLRGYRLLQAQKWTDAATAFEKARLTKKYQHQPETYLDGAEAYSQLKQPLKAIEMLEIAAKEFDFRVDYQVKLANLYKETNQLQKAIATLTRLSSAHLAIAAEIPVHERIKAVYTEWKMPEAVAKEEQIINTLQKKK